MTPPSAAVFYLQARAFRSRLWPLIPMLLNRGVQRILVLGDPGFPDNAAIAEEVREIGGYYVAVDWQHQGPDALLTAISRYFAVPYPKRLVPVARKPRSVALRVDPQELALHVAQPECLQSLERYRYALAVAATLMDMLNAHFFLADQDTALTESSAFVLAMKQRRGVAAVPGFFSMFYQPSLRELPHRYPHRRVTSALGKFLCRAFPQWACDLDGEPILRLPPWDALAMEVLGLAPPEPWVIDSGYLDRIYVESPAIQDRILRANPCMAHAPLKVTGSPALDTLYRLRCDAFALRKDFAGKQGLALDKPTLLLALPGTCEGLYPTAGFADFATAVVSIVEAVRKFFTGNILLSLHPRTAPDIELLLRQGPWFVSHEGTDRLLHLCDYVVNTGATITPWALMFGIPVLDYHIYAKENGKHLYAGSDAQGLVVVEDFAAFCATLAVLEKPGRWEALAAKAAANSDTWGFADGQCCERIADDLFGLLRGKRPDA